MAVSFSYAIAPVFMVLGLLLVFWWYPHWKKILQLWGALAASLLLFQLPTLAFEVKYRFQLTRAVLFGDRPTQVGIDVSSKLRSLGELILGGEQPWQVVLAVFLLFLLAGNLWFIRKRRDQGKQSPLTYTVFLTAFPLLLGTFLLTLILPIAVHSHYIFGFTTLLFLLLASLESRLRVIGLAIFSVFWLQPFFTASMFEPARRTVHDLESCAELVCAEETQPLFVATESRHHTFHNGPEFRYAFAHAGCIVNALEQDPSSAQYLAVVEDDGEYQHGKSDFYELSLFGKSEVIRTYQCSAKMQVFILERIE